MIGADTHLIACTAATLPVDSTVSAANSRTEMPLLAFSPNEVHLSFNNI